MPNKTQVSCPEGQSVQQRGYKTTVLGPRQSCRSRTQPLSGVGDASQDRVGVIQVNFNAYLKEFDYEQPENVQARRRSELAQHGMDDCD